MRAAHYEQWVSISFITFCSSHKEYFLSVREEGEFNFLAGPKAPEMYTFFSFS